MPTGNVGVVYGNADRRIHMIVKPDTGAIPIRPDETMVRVVRSIYEGQTYQELVASLGLLP